MLSIIICSISPENLERIRANIEETSITEHELIVYQNHEQRGLSEVYNLSAAKARYSNLCFVHEDVLFHTKGWDELVIHHLRDPATGVLGVMGGRYKSAFGLYWRDGKTEFYRLNVKDAVEHKHLSHYPAGEVISQVVCLDGAFLCCRKEIWEQFRFDEKHFRGFHFYDTDFSFRVAQHYFNYAINNILIEHFSQGDLDINFVEDSLRFDELYKANLPFTIETLSKKEIAQLEGYALTEKLKLLRKHRYPFSVRTRIFWKYVRRYFNFYQLLRNVYFGFVKS